MIAFGSDNLVSLTGLFDIVSNAYVNNATVQGVLTDSAGATVTTITLTYVASSNGNYQGLLPASVTAALEIGPMYQMTITATSGSTVFIDRQGHQVDYINT